jgi:hypothetical protein
MRLLDSGKVLLKQLTVQSVSKGGNDIEAPDETSANDLRQSSIREQLDAYKVSSSFIIVLSFECENQLFPTLFFCYLLSNLFCVCYLEFSAMAD